MSLCAAILQVQSRRKQEATGAGCAGAVLKKKRDRKGTQAGLEGVGETKKVEVKCGERGDKEREGNDLMERCKWESRGSA